MWSVLAHWTAAICLHSHQIMQPSYTVIVVIKRVDTILPDNTVPLTRKFIHTCDWLASHLRVFTCIKYAPREAVHACVFFMYWYTCTRQLAMRSHSHCRVARNWHASDTHVCMNLRESKQYCKWRWLKWYRTANLVCRFFSCTSSMCVFFVIS